MLPPSCIIDFQPNFGKNLLDRHLIFAASARSTVVRWRLRLPAARHGPAEKTVD
jgi:hypothetical protein